MSPGSFERVQRSIFVVRINNHARPVRILNIAVLLSLVRIRLVNSDAVAAIVQRFDQTAVISRRAIPVG